uniref:Uncharacterized protein n=1 Tax=Chenopodium quinoa TaxID=63459 RepID=A0A803N1Z2_CHEQI
MPCHLLLFTTAVTNTITPGPPAVLTPLNPLSPSSTPKTPHSPPPPESIQPLLPPPPQLPPLLPILPPSSGGYLPPPSPKVSHPPPSPPPPPPSSSGGSPKSSGGGSGKKPPSSESSPPVSFPLVINPAGPSPPNPYYYFYESNAAISSLPLPIYFSIVIIVAFNGVTPSSVWRLHFIRTFIGLVDRAQNDLGARTVIEEASVECSNRINLLLIKDKDEPQESLISDQHDAALDKGEGNLLEPQNFEEEVPEKEDVVEEEPTVDIEVKDPIQKRIKGQKNTRWKST